jgi:hypothetical protein
VLGADNIAVEVLSSVSRYPLSGWCFSTHGKSIEVEFKSDWQQGHFGGGHGGYCLDQAEEFVGNKINLIQYPQTSQFFSKYKPA